MYIYYLYINTHTRVRPLLCVSCVPASCVLVSCHYEFISCPAVFDNTNSLHLYSAFHLDDATAAIVRQNTPHTPATGGEETVMKPVGKFDQDAEVTPLLFFEGHPELFNDHRESGPRFNVSSERRCLLTV